MVMKRRKSKFLYHYLPNNTFNHAETDLSGRITQLKEEKDGDYQSVASSLPSRYILRRVSRHAAQWPNWDELSLSPEDTTIKTPREAKFEIYPLTFACGKCSSTKQFRSQEVADISAEDGSQVTCDRCGSRIRDYHQMRFIMVCRCGYMQDMYVPEHCGAGMGLRNPGVGFDNAYWYCTASDCSSTKDFFLGGKCFNPDCEQNNMRLYPHSASRTFYPQTQTLVNAKKNLDTLHSNDKYQSQIIADYLLHLSGNEGPTDDEVMDLAMDLRASGDADSNQEAREMAREQLTIDINEYRLETERFVQTHLPKKEQVRLSEELFEYLSVVSSDYDDGDRIFTNTFDELLNDPASETHLTDERLEEYLRLTEELNLDEVRLIKNFPVTTVAYGYSRLSPDPSGDLGGTISDGSISTDGGAVTDDEATTDGQDELSSTASGGDQEEAPPLLNLFNSGRWGETEVFARTNDAEAVMITLDKEAVLNWLARNDVIETPDVDDIDKWFVANVGSPGRFDRIEPVATSVTRHCYTLLHSFSHIVVDAIGTLSGYGRDSLVENLLPRAMSTIIYKRSDTDYSLGSVFTLFEERFDEVVEQLEEAGYCTFDTVCRRDHNCACEDCMYLSVLTCQNINYNLSRSVYFGGPFDGREIVGFNEM